ncbi:hypothetical protein ALI22I_17565 [Saccharothrix sp. ALI-22-I]|uniref:FtsX-like permease family protein n=1 Tax=Saccharothrix sp. ALI-22-I TaxID=1933778 RepID=UPI00097CC0A3|nr:FtsX-like permease family protein [Saccharothrix sp. ALI-22-I]ONI88791.1 hypothetical protein ALI22I_17565 [Saccharothrix sp. ALI-22-I]
MLVHRPALYVGAFVALSLATGLVGVTLAALQAIFDAQTPGGPVVVVNGGSFSRDPVDLGGIDNVLVISATVSTFVGILVVASAFGFGVAMRRRDLALLRLVAAGGGQVRRLVLGESLVVGTLAGIAGSGLAVLTAPLAGQALSGGFSPVPLTVQPNLVHLLITFAIGLVVALLGANLSARRAARVRPAEALREADLDTGLVSAGRLLMSVPLLVGGIVMLVLAPGGGAEASTPLAVFGGLALTAGAAALGPLYQPALARAVLLPARGTMGRLAAASVGTARRRTAAIVTPVFVVLAVTGVLSAVLGTTQGALRADEQTRQRAELTMPDPSAGGYAAARATPGVAAVSAPASLPIVLARDVDTAERRIASVVDLPAWTATTAVDDLTGDPGPLASDEIAISRDYSGWYGFRLGSTIDATLFDGRTVTLTVVAIVAAGSVGPAVMVSPDLAPNQVEPPRSALLDLAPGVDAADVAGRLRAAGHDVHTTGATTGRSAEDAANFAVMVIITGPAVGYALVMIVSVLVMAGATRGRELMTLRLLGAGRARVRRLLLCETAAAVTVGIALAAAITAASLLAHRSALLREFAVAPPTVAWSWCVAVAAAFAGVAGVVAVTTADARVRRLSASAN